MIRILLLLLISYIGLSQVIISGKVIDEDSGEPLGGANVFSQEAGIGTMTDSEGKFSISYSGTFPLPLTITYFGYDTTKIILQEPKTNLVIKLRFKTTTQKEVVIKSSRISEKIYESPMTIEQMDLKAIELNPSADFYEGLGALKGVDVIHSSLGFKSINMRGFNSTRPIRILQIVDGMDNQSPGLNFPISNYAGAPEIDVQNVELLVGAQGTRYGPNAFNGTIVMNLKDPFIHEGLTVISKIGERQLADIAIRYAKKASEKLAFKTSISFMKVYDWEATNDQPTPQSLRGKDNPGGYDAVNRYGDENVNPLSNNLSDPYGRRFYPGLDIYYRTGYWEKDVADYNSYNAKFNAAVHYKITDKLRLITTYNGGTGTTIFQGDNRYALKDVIMQQARVELKHPNFYIRAYSTWEDAGKSYDLVFTSILLQNYVRADSRWGLDYANYWARNYAPKIRQLASANGISPYDPAQLSRLDSLVATLYDSLIIWHAITRQYADGYIDTTIPRRLEPGTPEFKRVLQQITTKRTFLEGGSRFFDKSALHHAQGEYIFNTNIGKIVIGGNYRIYAPRSDGTIFSDTLIDPEKPELGYKKIRVHEYGTFLLYNKKLFSERVTMDLGLRMDKNQNFQHLFSPAASFVYKIRDKHNARLAFFSALRNPTLQDQYIYYNVGRAILIGNLEGSDTLVALQSLYDYIETVDPDTLKFRKIRPIEPEKVRSVEIGYKGMFGVKLFVDMSYYLSVYKDFIGFILASTDPGTYSNPKPIQIYRVSANADHIVVTQGFSLGLHYYIGKYYELTGNWSWNELDRNGGWLNSAIKEINKIAGKQVINELNVGYDPIIPAFNTPRNKFNIGFNGRDIKLSVGKLKLYNWGFGVNFKWVEGYWYEGSPQFTGYVPTYYVLDAQLTKNIHEWNTSVKLGASNLLNRPYFQAFGSPYIGRLAYLQVTVNVK